MDDITNPFSPGAGVPPPDLVGRKNILHNAEISQERVKNGRSAQSILLHGLRGIGKTVLLIEMEKTAKRGGFHTILIEADEEMSLAQALALPLRKLLLNEGVGEKVKRALAALTGFIGALKISVPGISLDITPALGVADSGDLSFDLPDLLVAVAEVAEEQNNAIILFIDEAQYLKPKELGALITAVHRIQQKQLPLLLIGAGLSTLPKLVGDAKSYSERLFTFCPIGALSDDEARQALENPTKAQDVIFELGAIEEIIRLTQGYPYFLQLWGYESWSRADEPVIKKTTVQAVESDVIEKLDNSFFRVRFDGLTSTEKKFLRAMAELPAGTKRTADVAARLGVKIGGIGPQRNNLIKKGMVYSPSHGNINFTVPLFDDFMKREMPHFNPSLVD